MEAHAEHAQHHEMPTSGNALTGVAVNATLHCLTGCAIGEVTGVALGTALGFSNAATIVLAIALAFVFGYGLTSLPLLRAGLALSAVVPIALAADTISITTMEIVDNAIILIIPGAMEAGLGSVLFWGSLAFALAIAFVLTVPINRWLIARGKGHTALHETGIHGGPPLKAVGAVVIVGFVFGTTVLVADALNGDSMGAHGESSMASSGEHSAAGGGGGHPEEPAAAGAAVPGLAVADGGLELELSRSELEPGMSAELAFRVVGADGAAITDYDLEHARRMHLIVVRRDLTGFQHLHPTLGADGTWTTRLRLSDPGSYRVFANFTHDGQAVTLGSDLAVDGDANYRRLPRPAAAATTADGYRVELDGSSATAGEEAELAFTVTRRGRPVEPEPYLGADGHLVALREGDLAFLHVHPLDAAGAGDPIRYAAEFPSDGHYRLFLQFKDGGRVHTAEFTRAVGP